MGININTAITELQKKRKVFCSEADFQLELAWILKEQNPNYHVRLEYVPSFNKKMHIDIVLLNDNEFIPIELKYKTKYCDIDIENEHYSLANHGAQDVGKYLYLKDIYRILQQGGRALLHHSNYYENYKADFSNAPGSRNFMSKECFAYLAYRVGFTVVEQKVIDWNGVKNLDCITLLEK